MSKPWATRIALAVGRGCAVLLAASRAPATAPRPHDRPPPPSSKPPGQALGTVLFPPPEALSLSYQPHLLVAQAFIPPTERTEVAGFDFPGDNDAIRAEVLLRLNNNANYRALFGRLFPTVRAGAPITFDMFGKAI